MVRQAALRTKGSGGPSGIDANGFRRMMASKSFKQSSSKLCDAIATMTKILCTHFIDPSTIEAVVASRLIPLDKGEGEVRPIGVGEVLRRIMGKCVMNVAKNDVVGVSGSLQLCAGQKSGSEAAIHAMHTIFESDETDAVLLIDASNAFNSLNRAAALHNVRVLCPIIAVYAINTYRLSSRLFITGGQEILSAEGWLARNGTIRLKYATSNYWSPGSMWDRAVLVCRWCQRSWLCFGNQEVVGHLEYDRPGFWLLPKSQEMLGYHQARQGGSREGGVQGNSFECNNTRAETSWSCDRLTRICGGLCEW